MPKIQWEKPAIVEVVKVRQISNFWKQAMAAAQSQEAYIGRLKAAGCQVMGDTVYIQSDNKEALKILDEIVSSRPSQTK